jgi:hypothetical protein
MEGTMDQEIDEDGLKYDIAEAILAFKCPKGYTLAPEYKLTGEQLRLPVSERNFKTKVSGKDTTLSATAYWCGVRLTKCKNNPSNKGTLLAFNHVRSESGDIETACESLIDHETLVNKEWDRYLIIAKK